MKKTLRTALTAAVFAAANLSAMPSMAAGDSSGQQGEEVGNLTPFSFDDWVRITDQTTYNLYGVPQTFDPNQISNADWMNQLVEFSDLEKTVTTATTTSVPALVYGPAPTTTVSDADWDDVVTTLTTVMIPQPAYGAPEAIIGDVNFDNQTNSFDVLAVRKLLVKGSDAYKDNAMDLKQADINADGKLNIADLLLLQRYVLGKISKNEIIDRYGLNWSDVSVEPITTAADNDDQVITTTTEPYFPGGDVVISLYGIKPVDDRLREMIEDSINDIQEK